MMAIQKYEHGKPKRGSMYSFITAKEFTSYQKLKAVQKILVLMNRKSELGRLVEWAKNKHLSGQGQKYDAVQKSYERHRLKLHNKLLYLRVRFPKQYWLALILHNLSNLLSQKPAYYAGSVSSYRNK